MYVEHFIRVMAGVVVLLGVALGFFVNEYCLLIVVFAAANLVQSAFTGICPPIIVLRALGWLDANDHITWFHDNRKDKKAAGAVPDAAKAAAPAPSTSVSAAEPAQLQVVVHAQPTA